LLPYRAVPLSSGVDASWVWGVNHVSQTGAAAGRDYAFPYGPLGSLVVPLAGGPHGRWVLALRLLLHGLFALALAWALRGRPPAQVLAFTLPVLLGSAVGGSYEVQLLFWLALLFALALDEPRARPLLGPLCAAFAVGLALAKISLGISAGVFLAGLTAFLLWRRAVGEVLLLGLALLAAAGAAVALGFGVFGAVGAAGEWLSAEWEFLTGMSVAMSLPGPAPELAAGLLSAMAFTGLALHAAASRSRPAAFLVLAAPVVWLNFRHGFVRQDAHVEIFFGAALLFLAIGLLLAGSARELLAAGAVALGVAILGVGSGLYYGRSDGRSLAAGLTGFAGLGARGGLAQPLADWQAPPWWQTGSWQRENRLPETWLSPLRAAGLGFDSLPQELSILGANGLRWVPSPTLQLYLAYTRELDERSARHFSGPRAPDVLLVTYGSIDGRNPLWDPPATWRAILQRYAPIPSPRPDLTALRRLPRPQTWRWQGPQEEPFEIGEPIAIPAAEDLLFAHLDLRLTLAGRLQAALFRVPPVYAVVQFDDGRRKSWRLLPETASQGLLVAPLPRNAGTFAALFAPRQAAAELPRAVRLRLTGPGCRYLARSARVTWRAARREEP
ncbi:MAG TPA: hypothetical protein VMM92_06660, partial [Thermoanaerobaculia bacterium]|nr:hypothetical protein [Thermoanaerobaculia bacterium]